MSISQMQRHGGRRSGVLAAVAFSAGLAAGALTGGVVAVSVAAPFQVCYFTNTSCGYGVLNSGQVCSRTSPIGPITERPFTVNRFSPTLKRVTVFQDNNFVRDYDGVGPEGRWVVQIFNQPQGRGYRCAYLGGGTGQINGGYYSIPGT